MSTRKKASLWLVKIDAAGNIGVDGKAALSLDFRYDQII